MKWPETLILMRHGQSQRNVEKEDAKRTGQKFSWSESPVRDVDTPLTDLGRQQCQAVGSVLRGEYPLIDAMIVSPYLRTVQSAEEVVTGLGYKPSKHQLEERIRELEFGILDGMTPKGIQDKFPEEVARRKKEGKYWYRPPGGESRPDVRLRVHSFLDTLIRDYQNQRVLVICHSVVVQAFRSLLERWGEREYLFSDKNEDVKNASLTVYKSDPMDGKMIRRLVNYSYYENQTSQPSNNDPAGEAQ